MSDLAIPLDLAALEGALGFTSDRRLFELQGDGDLGQLLVEAWSLRESLSQPWLITVSTLSLRADLDIHAMLGRKLVLDTVLADGSRYSRSGIVMAASADDADGSLARYRLTVQPWLGLLAHTRRSQVWQDRSLVQIVDSVFSRYSEHAAWTWAADTAAHLAASPFSDDRGLRAYTVQYRETDLHFVHRLLAEEGLVYRFETDPAAPLGHRLVLLADTPTVHSTPVDRTSAAGAGVRYHRASSREEQDAIQAFGGSRSLQAAATTVLAWHPIAKRAVAASVPTAAAFAGPNAPRLESYDPVGGHLFANTEQAERAGVLGQQALEARHKTWLGRGTVRSFSAGTRFDLTESALDGLAELAESGSTGRANTFVLLDVIHAGINNLPKDLSQRIAQRFDQGAVDLLEPWVDAQVRQQAQATGYGNAFQALRAEVPWRPLLEDGTGARLNPKPTAPGVLTATVVGPDGQTQTHGADEIHTDRLGRIRIQFDFQRVDEAQGPDTSRASTWVRVLQRFAGPGLGAQFIPRIGQEVLVDFLDGDIDQPLVIGAVYNGRGEAGLPATPGGAPAEADASAFGFSTDHQPSAQGNLAGGHSPAWHGASPQDLSAGGQRNAAALSGYKTQEFGGWGYNQLVFDDSDAQLRTQLATTQHATQLNLGHLIHQADNHRGSFRGLGLELRTDAWGAIRGGKGVLLSTYATQASEPAGDNAAGLALMGQLKTLAQTFSDAARTHRTVQLAGHIGSAKPKQCAVDDQAAPLPALHTVLKGMVSDAGPDQADGDAQARRTATGPDKLPHTTDPVIAISAKAGLTVVAGQDIQMAAGEGIVLASGENTNWAAGGAARLHTGQAIGVLAGAIEPGQGAAGTGITLIAGQGDIEVQAQADELRVAAQGDVAIQSQSAHIDWAAAKKITLATAGGASIVIKGGNITVSCPGKLSVWAGKKSFVGPEPANYPLPTLPGQVCVACLLSARATGAPFSFR